MSMVFSGPKRMYLCLGTALGLITFKCNISKKKFSSPIIHLKDQHIGTVAQYKDNLLLVYAEFTMFGRKDDFFLVYDFLKKRILRKMQIPPRQQFPLGVIQSPLSKHIFIYKSQRGILEVDLLHNELNILYETKSALHAFDLSLNCDGQL